MQSTIKSFVHKCMSFHKVILRRTSSFHCLSTCMFVMDHLWRLTYWEINTHLQMTWKAKGIVFFLQYQNAFLLASTTLTVMLVTFLLVCFASLFSKRELFRDKKNVFISFWKHFSFLRYQILTFQMFTCHDIVKCPSKKHETHFTE